jgi:two-component system CheB/CheR fusion protein
VAFTALFSPRLTDGGRSHDPIRIWTLGCSTGEEAYSVAMCYTEYAESTGQRVPLQIFATDVNGIGIEMARAGRYTKGIAQDVSPDRLRRFFVEVDGSYRISKPIRDMCVFARQNALVDPPFSRIDLVACRNMLIYLEPVLQQRLIRLLHYALKPEGFMWLGASETIGTYRELFEPVDLKHKVYGRRASDAGSGTAAPAALRGSTTGAATNRAQTLDGLVSAQAYGEADRAVLSRYSPPGALVNEALEVLQFRGDTGAYLAPASGRASLNVLKMLREDLVIAVRAALHKAKRDRTMVREEGLRMRSGGRTVEVDVVVLPVGKDSGYLVLFEEPASRQRARVRTLEAQLRAATQAIAPASADRDGAQQIARLNQELSTTREYLQTVIEQQEAANEELQSANEEVQSANEELQSINEELETSKEEIQSANEELATVNDELQDRNRQLSELNNDLANLLASANMAIVMLGPDLRIRRFTQAAEKILSLIGADIGRSIADIRLAINAPELTALIGDVVENVTTRECEVQDHDGRWYSLRVRPYRTFENKIDGAVLMLVDVDNLKRSEQVIRESEQRFEALADTAAVLIWVDDLDVPRFVNRAFQDFVGATEAQIRRTGHAQFVHPDERDAYVDKYAKAVQEKRPFDMRLRLRRSDGEYRWMKLIALPRLIGDATLTGFVGCAFDITDMEEAEAALGELDRGKTEFLAVLAHELRNPLSGVSNASRLLEHGADAGVLEHAREIIERQTRHMVRMIDDLLDVSRLAYGKIRVVVAPVEVTALLRSAIEETAQRREEVGQTLSATIPEQPLFVLGDAVRLDQVFSNLLANASKFTRRDGRIWLNVEKEERRRGGATLAVRIRDNGVGIDKRLLPRIFDLFVQGDSPPERTNSGIGLGLTLARRLVDLHGGTIEAHSAGAALGSEFVVRLPLLQDPARTGVVRGGTQRSAVAARRILVVDDNFDSGDSLRMLLARMGHDVRLVGEGGPVPAMAAEFQPDLVVLDIGLPDMDGYSVARALRADARTKDAFIVAVTGYGRDEDRARSLAAGIDDHMTKPVDPDALMQRVYAAGGGAAD